MKSIRTVAIAIAAIGLLSVGCKNAEKKRRTGGDQTASTDPGKAAQAPATKTPASPHGAPAASPHGKPAASPHGGAAGAPPHGGGGPMVGGKVKAGPTAADGTKSMGPVSIVVPKSWTESPPSSGMRLAQWKIGDADPAELVAFHFPGGGSIDANLNRWYGQFKQADGSPSKDKALRKDETIDGLAVTTVSVKGHFVAAMRPGAPAKHNKPNHQLLAAIISTDKGPIFLKMTGPEKTVTAAEKDWAQMINSIKKSAE